MGRTKGSTKFDPKLHCKIEEYLEEHQDTYEARQMERSQLKVKLPTIEGYAHYIGIWKETIYRWAETIPEISNALELIRKEQKDRLLNMGLSGEYNPTIAKLVLAANHNMRDKTDMTSGGKTIANTITLKKFDEPDSEL